MTLRDAMVVRMLGEAIGRKTGLSVSHLLELPDRNLYSIPAAFQRESDMV